MDTNALKKFAQAARNLLIDQVRSKLDLVLDPASPPRREHPHAMKELDAVIARDGKVQVIERVAYSWFNRFTALRFMDAKGYTKVAVVSPTKGQTHPEILAEAMAGNLPEGAPAEIAAHIDGRTPSSDPQAEAYRLLLVHACNWWHGPMPFLFEELDDYTELLLPEDLLSQTSILVRLRTVMTRDACQDVEIIGWLYQFYISEKKDQVFAGLKKNQKITSENIPAATQLFTPHWIVRYLVENSLGRLWLLNRPQSRLAERMDYYIAPEEPEKDFLKVTRPEEIRICDPAAGSGHMLTYAFDLLYEIYEEEGYDPTKIPELILTRNLTGVEIDDRAGALAAFALAMKAAAKLGRRRFLRMEVKPDICVLQNVSFTEAELQDVAAVVGKAQFTDKLRETLAQFEQAKNFGSLIMPKLRTQMETLRVVESEIPGADLVLRPVLKRVASVLRMAEVLSQKYHVVVANPPYMGGKGMNGPLGSFAKSNYPESKSDLFAMFMERNLRMALNSGMMAMINMQSWMFLATFSQLRKNIIKRARVLSLLHLGEYAFDMIDGTVVSTCCFTLQSGRSNTPNKPYVFRLTEPKGEKAKSDLFLSQKQTKSTVDLDLFLDIEGSPIIYWKQADVIALLGSSEKISQKFVSGGRLKTHGDEKFLRFHWEVSRRKLGGRWRKLSHGGGIRRWYGYTIRVVDWSRAAKDHYAAHGGLPNMRFEGQVGTTTTKIAFENAFRIKEEDELYSSLAPTIFPRNSSEELNLDALITLNSSLGKDILLTVNPTMTVNVGDMLAVPFTSFSREERTLARFVLSEYQRDWNDNETSINFARPVMTDGAEPELANQYGRVRSHWADILAKVHAVECNLSEQVCQACGVSSIDSSIPVEQLSLNHNVAFRYGVKLSEEVCEKRLLTDIMTELLSYAVGCMFGRYSLDTPGLILANQGEKLADYLACVPEPSFLPDEDNVIPVLDADWFPDDIVDRFRKFLRVTFSEAQFRENLRYIEKALGKTIRKYFTKNFYADHVKRYKKRPIYWMFSSPNGTFNALIYLHRYRADTVSVLLNDYLREFISKLEGERGRLEKLSDDLNASQGQRTKALKEMAVIAKQIDELDEWERDVVFPLAQARIEIDLDDGVKANYPKFGTALKKVSGLEAKND